MSNGVSVFIVFGIVWGRRARDRAVWLCWWKNPFNAINMDNDNNERWKENCAAAISHRIGHFEMEMVYCRLGVGRVAIMKKSLIMIYSTEFVPQSFFRAIRFCSWTAPAATIKSNGQSSKEQIFIVFASVFFFCLSTKVINQYVCVREAPSCRKWTLVRHGTVRLANSRNDNRSIDRIANTDQRKYP